MTSGGDGTAHWHVPPDEEVKEGEVTDSGGEVTPLKTLCSRTVHKPHGNCMGLQLYYYTFGRDSQFKNHYVVVVAPSSMSARLIMMEHFGTYWSSEYFPHEWNGDSTACQSTYSGRLLNVTLRADLKDHERAMDESTWERFN